MTTISLKQNEIYMILEKITQSKDITPTARGLYLKLVDYLDDEWKRKIYNQ